MLELLIVSALATDLGATGRLALYALEDATVVERICEAATPWPSITTCTLGTRPVDASAFFKEAALVGPADRETVGSAARQSLAMMKDVENRIAELHASETDPDAAAALRLGIEAENRQLSKLESTLADTERQIAALGELIGSGSHDPELQAQIAIFQAKRVDDERRCKTERQVVVDLETQYVALLKETDGSEFADLVAWRGQLLAQWNEAKARYETSLAARADALRLIGYVRDAHASLPTLVTRAAATFPSLKPWAAEIEGVFERAAVATGTGDPALWFRTMHRGVLTSEDGHHVTIIGFRPSPDDPGMWLMDFTGHPDLEGQCYERASDLSYERLSTKVDYAYCSKTRHQCQRVDVFLNQTADRDFRLEATFDLLASNRLHVDIFGNCSKFPGTTSYWEGRGLPAMDFLWH